MAEIRDVNYSMTDPAGKIVDGDIILDGNFCQHTPGTEILRDVKELEIRDGNWGNVKPQPTWKVAGGNWAQISWCTHLRPELAGFGKKPCAKDCEHAVMTDLQAQTQATVRIAALRAVKIAELDTELAKTTATELATARYKAVVQG
jgi:hypothetical protein